jgi:TonB family protein
MIGIDPFNKFFSNVFAGFRNPAFIPSVFSDPEGWALERAQVRTRRWEAGVFSMALHAAILAIAYLLVHAARLPDLDKAKMVFVNNSVKTISLPFEFDDGEGGGGGGGKHQPMPPATGRIPETSRSQMVAPDPDNPQPLAPAEDLLAQVQMPIDSIQDLSLPIGDISAPPNYSVSSGPGSRGGIGTGDGIGIGPGKGPGAGSGSNGMGEGPGGGIGKKAGSQTGPYLVGNGVIAPVPLSQPLPSYTVEAQKARAEGIVLIRVVIRRDGTIDNIKVLRGLGYGLDESAINTIANKWRFKPGTRNGEAVDVQADIEVSFRLVTSSRM